MTDPSFDELASAHLDGATTPAEAARVAADPALQARVEELRRVRDAFAEVPPADPAHRDAAITAALAAFADDDTSSGAPVPVSSLAAVSTRRRPSPTTVRVLGAAAAVALLALLVPVLGRLAQSSDDDASFDSTGAAIESAPEAEAGSAEDNGGTTTTASRGAEADLGTFEDLTALVTAVSANDPQTSFGADSTLAAEPEAQGACPPATAKETSGDTAAARSIESVTATVSGDPVIVVVRTETAGTRTLLVYRADDCALLVERPL